MPVFRSGVVREIVESDAARTVCTVEVDGARVDAIGYLRSGHAPKVGDRVVVNVTGIDLGLGTGGTAFILWNLEHDRFEDVDGHIVKLRYSPSQMDVLAAEAPESPHHDALREADSLGGAPVVCCSLHSHLPAAAAGVRAAVPEARIGYLMTDGGALPLGLSETVRRLRDAGLLATTCTVGHAYGGDLESVNTFSGMVALRSIAEVDVIVAAMGPGVVGTGTKLGTTALEQGQLVDASAAVGGRPVAVLRLSFDDERERHRGLSHHTVTALTVAAHARSVVAVPKLSPERSRALAEQLRTSGICDRHETRISDGRPGLELLTRLDMDPTTMGRRMSESPDPFLAAAAAGRVAGELLGAVKG